MGDASRMVRRNARIAMHARAGYAWARRDAGYRRQVLAALEPELVQAVQDPWTAVPWLWALVLGHECEPSGPLADAVRSASELLRRWLEADAGCEPPRAVAPVDLACALRAHPFSGYRAWSLRTPFVGSS